MENKPISQQLQYYFFEDGFSNTCNSSEQCDEVMKRIIQQVKQLEEMIKHKDSIIYDLLHNQDKKLEKFEKELIDNNNKYLLKHEIIYMVKKHFSDKNDTGNKH